MGNPVSKQKKDNEDCNDAKAESENNKTKGDTKMAKTKKEEKLTVQIITNKEPVIEKIDEEFDKVLSNLKTAFLFWRLRMLRERGRQGGAHHNRELTFRSTNVSF